MELVRGRRPGLVKAGQDLFRTGRQRGAADRRAELLGETREPAGEVDDRDPDAPLLAQTIAGGDRVADDLQVADLPVVELAADRRRRIPEAVEALHRADWRLKHRAAGISELFTRIQMRLLADDAVAGYFLYLAIRIGDDPVATD